MCVRYLFARMVRRWFFALTILLVLVTCLRSHTPHWVIAVAAFSHPRISRYSTFHSFTTFTYHLRRFSCHVGPPRTRVCWVLLRSRRCTSTFTVVCSFDCPFHSTSFTGRRYLRTIVYEPSTCLRLLVISMPSFFSFKRKLRGCQLAEPGGACLPHPYFVPLLPATVDLPCCHSQLDETGGTPPWTAADTPPLGRPPHTAVAWTQHCTYREDSTANRHDC